MNEALSLDSMRARKARLGRYVGKKSWRVLQFGTLGYAVVAGLLAWEGERLAYLATSLALICFALAQWYQKDLSALPVRGNSLDERLSGEILSRLSERQTLTPQSVWITLSNHWQIIFMMNHLLLVSELVREFASNNETDMSAVWQHAREMADADGSEAIEPGHVATSIMLSSPDLLTTLQHYKITDKDIEEVGSWLGRLLDMMRLKKPFFGGIGRDWANGFTPMLNRFGQNISLGIEQSRAHFGAQTESTGVAAIERSFEQGANTIALIGPSGIGKTSHIHALAQRLLEGKVPQTLQYHQIVGLNPSVIISSAQHPGELEQIVLTLLSEAAHAGHIILFLDDAQLFFSNGPGSFDMTQILLPVVQSGAVRLILAMTPSDYQRLKAQNSAFAGMITPVMLTEQPEAQVMDILEDTALGFENRHNTFITYAAIREAYRLSGRYDQENAYPGKAINLLTQSLTHAKDKLITPQSVQEAIEQTRGVKVSAATQVEANQLLHLEDQIHERMINQSRAVTVVSAALRRARAGVSSPKRPIGSFLFLGPTGVGKTELAKAIAATYFGDEANMVRLDMSEYQQPEDVKRLLSSGKDDSMSLILAVRQQPFTVVLLDEIEKAHPNILNLLLQLLDEGALTDDTGRPVSFKDCIIIATSNAGADKIRERIEQGQELESFEKEFTDQLINSGQFKPELLNRFDEIVLFRPLKPEELAQVVKLMMNGINQTLSTQNITVALTDAAVMKIVEVGNDPRLGARPMRRMLQRAVEDGIAGRILRGETQAGDHVTLDVTDLAV
jgi:ATP-dependent Clp protease ATP-binding subunit ClpC